MTCPNCKRALPSPPGKVCIHCGRALAAGATRSSTSTPRGGDPLIGTEVSGRFRIEELIGQGGMGKVYRARHLALDKVICLKMLKPALLEDPTLVGRFEREAKAASRLNHANVIAVLDFGRIGNDGTLFIAMEYVQGKDLRLVLRDEWPLPEERLCHIMAQVLAALAEAHSHNVIHRDLKPENIMVEQRRDQPDFIKVLDFGIAKIMDSDMPGLTRNDVVCGTPQYMAPEQATGSALDNRCDLYAVGVILYQMATGHLPFDGQNSMEVLTKHVNELPIPPRKKQPDAPISEAMERLILRALEKEPAARPQTAEEFRQAILQIPQQAKAAAEELFHLSSPLPSEARLPAAKGSPSKLDLGRTDEEPGPPPALLFERRRSTLIKAVVGAGALLLLATAGLALRRGPEAAAGQTGKTASAAKEPTVQGASAGVALTNAVPATPREPKKAADLVLQATQMQADGNTAAARDLLEDALKFDADNAEAHFRLGGLFMVTKPDRARHEYEEARRLNPDKYAGQVQFILSGMQ